MTLKDLPADQRPREKLLARGAGALADGELLALLLRTGYKGRGVFELAGTVLDTCGGFAGLLNAPPRTLQRIKGLGPAKRAELMAVLEIARRALAQQMQAAPVFDSPQRVKDYVALHLGSREQEVFAVLFLDGQHRLLQLEEMFQGTLTQTSVYPREIVKRALEHLFQLQQPVLSVEEQHREDLLLARAQLQGHVVLHLLRRCEDRRSRCRPRRQKNVSSKRSDKPGIDG